MGSRAVVILCRDEEAALRRFGSVPPSGIGVCYTRTGRPMFADGNLERALLQKVLEACTGAELWQRLETDWVLLDCELMPWSAKAQELVADHYARVGAAAAPSLELAGEALSTAIGRGIDLHELQEQVVLRREAVDRYAEAYRRYCWPVQTVDDLCLAPFHVLATEARVHADETHEWHMEQVDLLAKTDAGVLVGTPHRTVDPSDETSEREAIEWWRQSADAGGEGMVLKPFDFIARSGRGIVQPGIKCRGHEYLRIIYGPEYDRPDNLLRRETAALSVEALTRAARVCPRDRGRHPIRASRAAVPSSRVRFRRPRSGKRACRSSALIVRAGGIMTLVPGGRLRVRGQN